MNVLSLEGVDSRMALDDKQHKRPLPPVESHTVVLAKSQFWNGWTPVDGDSDLLMATTFKLFNIGPPAVATHQLEQASLSKHQDDKSSSGGHHLQQKPHIMSEEKLHVPPKKKKRLTLAPISTEVVENIQAMTSSELQTNKVNTANNKIIPESSLEAKLELLGTTFSNEANTAVVPLTEGCITTIGHRSEDNSLLSEDEGYKSLPTSPSESETIIEQPEDLVTYLAKFHHANSTESAKSEKPDVIVHSFENTLEGLGVDQHECFEDAKKRMLQEQKTGEERSRFLRQRKLARRGFSGINEQNNFLNTSLLEDDKDACLSTPYITQHNFSGDDDRSIRTKPCFRSPEATNQTVFHNISRSPVNSHETNVRSYDDNDDYGLEMALDFAKHHALNRKSSAPSAFKDTLRSHRRRRYINRLHPASRSAAERFRTQGRHLANFPEPYDGFSAYRTQNTDAEQRLLRFTGIGEKRSDPVKLLDIDDLPDDLTNTSRNLSEDHLDNKTNSLSLENPGLINRTDDVEESTQGDIANGSDNHSSISTPDPTSASNESTTFSPLRRPSILEGLAERRRKTESQQRDSASSSATGSSSINHDKNGLSDIKHLTLPAQFASFPPEMQDLIVRHETAKEQYRDLAALEAALVGVAEIITARNLREVEINEIEELRVFAKDVIDNEKPGKYRRERIKQIKESMNRRIRWEPKLTDSSSQDILEKLLGLNRLRRLYQLKQAAESLDATLKVERRKLQNRRKDRSEPTRQKNKKTVRFQDNVDIGSKRIRTNLPGGPFQTERKIAHYQELLDKLSRASHNQGSKATSGSTQTDSLGLVAQNQGGMDSGIDDASDVSEEDDGAAYAFNAGASMSQGNSFTTARSFPGVSQDLIVEQDLDEINQLEEQRQQQQSALSPMTESTPSQTRSSGWQRPDEKLVEQMQKRRTRAKEAQPKNCKDFCGSPEMVCFDDTASEVGSDCSMDTDSVSESESESDSTGNCDVYHYKVLGRFTGFDTYSATEDYHFNDFISLDKANKAVSDLICSVQQHVDSRHRSNDNNWRLNVSFHDGMQEQVLEVGNTGELQARVWIERKVVTIHLRQTTYSKQKAQKLSQHRSMFIVDWMKVITTTTRNRKLTGKTTAISGSNDSNEKSNDNVDDDLFGPSRSPTPTVMTEVSENLPPDTPKTKITTSTVRATASDLCYFTSSVHANRQAKAIYMAWYTTFLPGYKNEPWRRQVEAQLERELERMGDWGLWSIEEELVRKETLDAEQRGSEPRLGNGGKESRISAEEDVEGEGEAIEVKEKFKVWVSKVAVFGPQN